MLSVSMEKFCGTYIVVFRTVEFGVELYRLPGRYALGLELAANTRKTQIASIWSYIGSITMYLYVGLIQK